MKKITLKPISILVEDDWDYGDLLFGLEDYYHSSLRDGIYESEILSIEEAEEEEDA